jgi:hypothetical protein
VNDSTQIHDFNAGFGPKVSNVDSGNGFGTRVFWTAVIPDSDVQVHPAAGTAEMHVRNLAEVNYYSPSGSAGNISVGPNWQTAGVDSTVSFDVVWNGPVTRRVNVRDATYGFAGTFNEVNNNNVTVRWSGSNALGFSFTSNVGNLTTSTALEPGFFFAQLAHERNGIFFPPGGSGGGGSGGSGDGPLSPAIAVPAQQGGALAAPPVSAALVLRGTDRGGIGSYASTAPPSASDGGTPSPARQTAQAVGPAYAALVHPGRTETRIDALDRFFVELANAPDDGLSNF